MSTSESQSILLETCRAELDGAAARRSRARWVIAVVYCVTLTFFLLVPESKWAGGGRGGTATLQEELVPSLVLHVVTYTGMSGLLLWASGAAFRPAAALWVVATIAHGWAAEGLQHFVPFRYPDFRDGLADSLGAGLGWGAIALAMWARRALAARVNRTTA